MKICKYRELPSGDAVAVARLERIVSTRLFWCARPDTLNDPAEFAWTCEFTESARTMRIVAELLEQVKGRPRALAMQIAGDVVSAGKLAEFGGPIIEDTISKCRDESESLASAMRQITDTVVPLRWRRLRRVR